MKRDKRSRQTDGQIKKKYREPEKQTGAERNKEKKEKRRAREGESQREVFAQG